MSVQVKVTGNLSTLKDQIEGLAEDHMREKLLGIAGDLILFSPVYQVGNMDGRIAKFSTNAYVNSHSVNFTGSGGGYGYSSENREYGSLSSLGSYERMSERIKSAEYEELQNTTFRNNSPHAQDVEYGGPDWRQDGYLVYRSAAGRSK